MVGAIPVKENLADSSILWHHYLAAGMAGENGEPRMEHTQAEQGPSSRRASAGSRETVVTITPLRDPVTNADLVIRAPAPNAASAATSGTRAIAAC